MEFLQYTSKTLQSVISVPFFLVLKEGILFGCSWCHRIFPIQATCCLKEKELQEVVSALVKKFVADKQNQLGRPLKVQYTWTIVNLSFLCPCNSFWFNTLKYFFDNFIISSILFDIKGTNEIMISFPIYHSYLTLHLPQL